MRAPGDGAFKPQHQQLWCFAHGTGKAFCASNIINNTRRAMTVSTSVTIDLKNNIECKK